MSANSSPLLSVILPTDTDETIQPVLKRLRRQSVADRIEIVLVRPRSAVARAGEKEDSFARFLVVEVESISPLGAARAAGIRAAAAPLIFVGETHSFLHSDAAEKLIAAAESGPWSAVAPGFGNANPGKLFSWAGFLGDYARWSASLPGGEISEAPLYNALYRRDVLLSLGDRLGEMLSHGDELRLALQAGGHRAYFEPAARIDHVNLDAAWRALHEHFLAGRLIGGQRARRWSWPRRLGYLLGSGLIPVVLLWRVLPGIRQSTKVQSVPAITLPLIFLLNVARALGEATSYALGGNVRQAAAMDHYEIHKLDYLT